MTTTQTVVRYLFLAAAACFVIGLHLMNSPKTARRGNLLSAAAMAVAIGATAVLLMADGAITVTGWVVLLAGAAVGSAAAPPHPAEGSG